ncbi:hypothetical protein CDD83_2199 [Cordyceps sp. RAO-2017]|nr:hypothetical protein CDD83_2199 [Cordyceps sp. RAO-2017]
MDPWSGHNSYCLLASLPLSRPCISHLLPSTYCPFTYISLPARCLPPQRRPGPPPAAAPADLLRPGHEIFPGSLVGTKILSAAQTTKPTQAPRPPDRPGRAQHDEDGAPAMAQLRLRETALRGLRAARAPAAALRRGYATDLEPEFPRPPRDSNENRLGRSFTGQVMGSIGARLRREREQREQYEKWRRMTDPSRNWMMTFAFLSSVGIAYWLGTFWPREPEPRSTLPLSKAGAPRHNTKLENMQAAWADFIKIVGKDNVSTAEADVEQHTTSAWSTHKPRPDERPFCVVYPGSTDEVSQLMRVCHRRRIPVVGYSGGTSLEGHYAQTRKGVSIDFSRMNRVLALHRDDMDVVVQPAVGWEELNQELAEQGLFFPPDPGPGAMIGGMVGTGCSGTNAFRYGTMRDWVLGLTVVMADGTVIRTRQRPRKSSAGYDLTRLFVGSEGTLGLVTEATLKLAAQPESTSVAVCSFRSVRDAAACVGQVVGRGVPIAAVEILDDSLMRYINAAGTTSRTWAEAPTLFFKFAGTAAGVREQVAQVRALAAQAGSRTFEFARSQQEQDELWSARKAALWSVMAAGRDSDRVSTGDVAVPISKLPALIEETREDIRKSGLVGSVLGHAGDGNFHTCLLYSEAQREKTEALVHRMVKRAIEMEGTISREGLTGDAGQGEHGVGLVKRDALPHELGETTVDAMRQIKKAFDPLCLLNCDKVVRSHVPLHDAAVPRAGARVPGSRSLAARRPDAAQGRAAALPPAPGRILAREARDGAGVRRAAAQWDPAALRRARAAAAADRGDRLHQEPRHLQGPRPAQAGGQRGVGAGLARARRLAARPDLPAHLPPAAGPDVRRRVHTAGGRPGGGHLRAVVPGRRLQLLAGRVVVLAGQGRRVAAVGVAEPGGHLDGRLQRRLVGRGPAGAVDGAAAERQAAVGLGARQGHVPGRGVADPALRRRAGGPVPQVDEQRVPHPAGRDDAAGARRRAGAAERHLPQERAEDGDPQDAQGQQRARPRPPQRRRARPPGRPDRHGPVVDEHGLRRLGRRRRRRRPGARRRQLVGRVLLQLLLPRLRHPAVDAEPALGPAAGRRRRRRRRREREPRQVPPPGPAGGDEAGAARQHPRLLRVQPAPPVSVGD